MATINEDYVSFETAKLLKEKGFNGILPFIYVNTEKSDREVHLMDTLCNYNDDHVKDVISAPTLQMTMKWLREVHGLHISLEPCYDYDSMHVIFLAFVQNVADVHEFMDGKKNVASHPNAEKSCELAILYVLNNLI